MAWVICYECLFSEFSGSVWQEFTGQYELLIFSTIINFTPSTSANVSCQSDRCSKVFLTIIFLSFLWCTGDEFDLKEKIFTQVEGLDQVYFPGE